VVRVAVRQRLRDGVAQAGHVGVAGPVPGRQRRLGVQRVALQVAGHLRPVDAAHVFAPAQDLADEAFHRRQRRMAAAVRGFGRGHHLARVQQLEVERRAQLRVPEPDLAGPHRVLELAEQRQAPLDEVVQGAPGVGAGDGPGEAVQ
jgi:hypothetical protein